MSSKELGLRGGGSSMWCCVMIQNDNSNVCVCGPVCTGDDDVYVSHSGSNTPLCGPSAQPCATLRYALAHRPNATQIYIDSSSGAYTEEAGTEYMLADHDLTLSGSGPHPAVIQCTDNQHTKLFHFSPAPHHGPIKVGIEVIISVFLHDDS